MVEYEHEDRKGNLTTRAHNVYRDEQTSIARSENQADMDCKERSGIRTLFAKTTASREDRGRVTPSQVAGAGKPLRQEPIEGPDAIATQSMVARKPFRARARVDDEHEVKLQSGERALVGTSD